MRQQLLYLLFFAVVTDMEKYILKLSTDLLIDFVVLKWIDGQLSKDCVWNSRFPGREDPSDSKCLT